MRAARRTIVCKPGFSHALFDVPVQGSCLERGTKQPTASPKSIRAAVGSLVSTRPQSSKSINIGLWLESYAGGAMNRIPRLFVTAAFAAAVASHVINILLLSHVNSFLPLLG
jgi:hypothetical protein